MTWDKFIEKIPRFNNNIIKDDMKVYLLNPYNTVDCVSDKITTAGDGCCTRWGLNFQVNVPSYRYNVTHDEKDYDAICLSDLTIETGSWGKGSKVDFENEAEDRRDLKTFLQMICPYDIIKYHLGNELIPYSYTEVHTYYDYNYQDNSKLFADVVENLFGGLVLIEIEEDPDFMDSYEIAAYGQD
uniref:Uncharacterized protein n=1 Tax=viral metagenome TaxID=1070528 RepID=A0A6C0JBP2_9ZZZZ